MKRHCRKVQVQKQETTRRIGWVNGIAFAQLAFLIIWYSGLLPAAWVEHIYARGWYRVVLATLPLLTAWTSYSVFVMLAPLALIAALVMAFRTWRSPENKAEPRLVRLAALLRTPVISAIMLTFFFVVLWGGGYARLPVETRLGLGDAKPTENELRHIAGAALRLVQENAQPGITRDRDGAIAAIATEMAQLTEEWDHRPIRLPRFVKQTPPGVFLVNGTAGMCSPLTLEAQVDGALPEASFVSVAAHELAHLAGNCPEDEASFIGYLAGLSSDHPFARYAVALRLFRDAAGYLPAEERKSMTDALPELAKEDLKRAAEASKRYRIQFAERTSKKVYNQYLKTQGVKSGIRNYGEVTTLFVRAWQKGWVPAIPALENESSS